MLSKLNNLAIRAKLVLGFILTGILPLVITGYYGSILATDAMMKKSFEQMAAVQEIKTSQIESVFKQRFIDIKQLATTRQILMASQNLSVYHDTKASSPVEASPFYERFINDNINQLQRFAHSFGCTDILIIGRDNARILFSLENRDVIGQQLGQSTWAGTHLFQVYKTVIDTGKLSVTDFSPFAPDRDKEAAFLGEPVIDEKGQIISVVIIKLTDKFIDSIMQSRAGMGETGESYLLHYDPVGDRFEFRSNVRTGNRNIIALGSSLDQTLEYWQDAVEKSFGGSFGLYKDSSGNPVLVAFNKLNIKDMNWYLISKIDKYEIEDSVRKIIGKTLSISILLIAGIGVIAFGLSKTISGPIVKAVAFAQAITQGKYNTTIKLRQRDELGVLAGALNRMALSLNQADWLKQGKEGLDQALRGDLDAHELGRHFISFVCRHLNAGLGVLYVNENGVFNVCASYAFLDRDNRFSKLNPGQGLVGQAVSDQKVMVFTKTQEDLPDINYGAGQTPATEYMAVPLVFENEVVGAFLLGSQNRFTGLENEFIEQITEKTAILLKAAGNRQTIKALLDASRVHQKELSDKNEALEARTLALKTSESRLQAQKEELKTLNEELEEQAAALRESEINLQKTNAELEEQAQALEEQKEDIQKKNIDLFDAHQAIEAKAGELERAGRYKSEFLANMSHELRTPLNSILILSQMLSANKEENLSEKQVECSEAIHSSGQDLLTLINEILDLSKVEAGKVELMPEEVRVSALTSDLERIFKTVAQQKKVDFQISVDRPVPAVVFTDGFRVQQILRNFLTNAFKFTEKGLVSLLISRPDEMVCKEHGIDPSQAVAFAVKDSGIGIPEDKQSAIFEAFQQADGSTSRKYGGTGLGLTISRQLAGLLGGVIILDSESGKGSVFTLVIPERLMEEGAYVPSEKVGAPDHSPSLSQPAPTESQEKTEPPPVINSSKRFVKDDRKKIEPKDKVLLIIEDDPGSARIMRDFARERGFKCLVAETGEIGLHFADFFQPSGIILDIGLPGIDGWQVLDRLKNNAGLCHIPVHFMSAADDSSMTAMKRGAVGFLAKPVTLEKVEETFKRIENIITRPVRRLLIVEDDKTQANSIRELIAGKDLETQIAATGAAACEKLAAGPYDCMILDLGLEDMSGFDLLGRIRKEPSCRNLPVIIYTGRDLTQDEERQLRKYTDSIIIKGARSPERLIEESALFLHRVEADLPKEKQSKLKKVPANGNILKDKTVLVVDDDMRNVFALSSVLEDKNMKILIARDGQEGVEKVLAHQEIDIVLMDIMMPKMDGYQAIRKIRETHQDLPVIALTAKAMKGDRDKCIEAGASDYLAKPVDTDKLISMLRVWLYE